MTNGDKAGETMIRGIRTRVTAVAGAMVLAGGLATAAHAAPQDDAKPGMLFSVLADTSTVTVSPYSTSITVPASSTTAWFTDRPSRKAGTITLGHLVNQWDTAGFQTAPPNAALILHDGTATSQVVVKLSKPRINGPVVTFTVKPLATTRVLGMATRTNLEAGTYAATEIFIDDADPISTATVPTPIFTLDPTPRLTLGWNLGSPGSPVAASFAIEVRSAGIPVISCQGAVLSTVVGCAPPRFDPAKAYEATLTLTAEDGTVQSSTGRFDPSEMPIGPTNLVAGTQGTTVTLAWSRGDTRIDNSFHEWVYLSGQGTVSHDGGGPTAETFINVSPGSHTATIATSRTSSDGSPYTRIDVFGPVTVS